MPSTNSLEGKAQEKKNKSTICTWNWVLLKTLSSTSTTYGKQLGNYTSLMHLIRKIDVWQSNKSLWMSSVMMIAFLEWLLLWLLALCVQISWFFLIEKNHLGLCTIISRIMKIVHSVTLWLHKETIEIPMSNMQFPVQKVENNIYL